MDAAAGEDTGAPPGPGCLELFVRQAAETDASPGRSGRAERVAGCKIIRGWKLAGRSQPMAERAPGVSIAERSFA